MQEVLLGKGKSTWKCLEVRACQVCLKKRKRASVAGAERVRGRVRGEVPEVRETDTVGPCRTL